MQDEEIKKADFTIYLLLRNCNFLKYDENWFITKKNAMWEEEQKD